MTATPTIETPEEARALMRRALASGDASILEPHLRRASTDAMEEAFAIVRGSAGIDMTVTERFLTAMMVQGLLTVDDAAAFARQMHPSAEGARPTQETTMAGHAGSRRAAVERRLDAMRLQEIEGNPLDAEDVAMFEMFEREGWSHERRRAYILSMARPAAAAK